MARRTEKVRLCKGHNSPLLNCLGDIRISEFYISWSKFTDGYVPYCKNCINKIYEYLHKVLNLQIPNKKICIKIYAEIGFY